MAARGTDPFAEAKTLYGQTLTPPVTRQIRDLLQAFVASPGSNYSASDVAYGWSLLANIKLCDYLNRWNSAGQTELDTAKSDITTALTLDPKQAFAYYAKGFLKRANGDHAAAQEAFKTSLALAPSARACAQYANEFVYLGQPDQAVQEIEAAIAANPNHPALGMFQWIKGRALFFMEKYDEAIPCLQESMRSWQALWYNRLYLASAYAFTRNLPAAHSELQDFDQHFPGYKTLAQIGQLERTSPNESPLSLAGRRNFHTGLRLAGRI